MATIVVVDVRYTMLAFNDVLCVDDVFCWVIFVNIDMT